MIKHQNLSPLEESIKQLESWCKILMKSRQAYLLKEAEKKHFEAKLVMAQEEISSDGKVIAFSIKQAKAYASNEYLEFSKQLALLESKYENDKLVYEVLEKNYQAIYLETKIDNQLIIKS